MAVWRIHFVQNGVEDFRDCENAGGLSEFAAAKLLRARLFPNKVFVALPGANASSALNSLTSLGVEITRIEDRSL